MATNKLPIKKIFKGEKVYGFKPKGNDDIRYIYNESGCVAFKIKTSTSLYELIKAELKIEKPLNSEHKTKIANTFETYEKYLGKSNKNLIGQLTRFVCINAMGDCSYMIAPDSNKAKIRLLQRKYIEPFNETKGWTAYIPNTEINSPIILNCDDDDTIVLIAPVKLNTDIQKEWERMLKCFN